MKKYGHITLKVILSLLLITPILGATGIFPPPTAEMYQTVVAFDFISVLMKSYIVWGMALTCLCTIIALWSRREALAAMLLLPLTVNIIGFHAFLDGGLFTAGALMGNLLLLLNIYFLFMNRKDYQTLFAPKK